MTLLDRILQRWRMLRASKYIPPGSRVLDIGCADGVIFEMLKNRISEGIGIDPILDEVITEDRYHLYPGHFPEALPATMEKFDVITLLAVIEHIPSEQLSAFACACAESLNPNGHLIITVPSKLVDPILEVLVRLRLVKGMSLEEHHRYEVSSTPTIFSVAGLRLVKAKRFQFGLNNLFVFQKIV